MPTIDELINEATEASEKFWFIQGLNLIDRTDNTVTIQLRIADSLFIQAFLSQRSTRFSLALVSSAGRLYGRDLERGMWHRHPFGKAHEHEPIPEGMSTRPLIEFMTEVEEILLTNGLI